jgi:hypothetical protein
MIDYRVSVSGPLKLEIRDSAGKAVRTFESGPAAGSQVAQGMRAPERRAGGPPRLGVEPGLNRFVWDLRHEGIPGARGGAGPMVAPGVYSVRLSAGEWSAERSLRVTLDPRVAKDGITEAIVAEQTKLLLDIQARIAEARALLQGLKNARATADSAKAKTVDELISQLENAGGAYPQPMLIDQFGSVARMLGAADQKPGRDAYERYNDLVKELNAIAAAARSTGV